MKPNNNQPHSGRFFVLPATSVDLEEQPSPTGSTGPNPHHLDWSALLSLAELSKHNLVPLPPRPAQKLRRVPRPQRSRPCAPSKWPFGTAALTPLLAATSPQTHNEPTQRSKHSIWRIARWGTVNRGCKRHWKPLPGSCRQSDKLARIRVLHPNDLKESVSLSGED